MRWLLMALLLATPASAAVSSALETALAAHARADYATARKALLVLAARGSPVAETLLGGMAAHGQGAPADLATAAAWWLRAAQRGYAPAQLALARAMADGRGVGQDTGQAWLWATRASRAAGPVSDEARGLAGVLARRITPEERRRLLRSDESWKLRP